MPQHGSLARSLPLWALLLATAAMAVRQRSNRDWASMSDADWARVEEELEEPEDKAAREEFARKAQQPKQTIDMDAYNNAKTEADKQTILKAAAAAQGTPGKGMAMGYVFVTVNFEGCCPEDRKSITELGRKWSALLASIGMDAAPSVWKDNQVPPGLSAFFLAAFLVPTALSATTDVLSQMAFQTKHEAHVKEITDFAMLQPETAVVRHDLDDVYGPAATPEFIEEWEKSKAEREAAKEEKKRKAQAQQAAIKRAQEAKKKKKKKKKNPPLGRYADGPEAGKEEL